VQDPFPHFFPGPAGLAGRAAAVDAPRMLPPRLLPFLLLPCLLPAATAQVRRVPTQYATITAALQAAQQGDTILVAPGNYQELIVWPATQLLRLVAESGPASTTIDANKTGTPLTMSRSMTRATLVEGFTITGGLLTGQRNYGAGIHLSGGASPTIRGCVITGNESNGTYWNYGGGVYIDGSGTSPRLELCRIEKNVLKAGSCNYGAGV
jgi:hypothetical protein